jgi:hypothetical protein
VLNLPLSVTADHVRLSMSTSGNAVFYINVHATTSHSHYLVFQEYQRRIITGVINTGGMLHRVRVGGCSIGQRDMYGSHRQELL